MKNSILALMLLLVVAACTPMEKITDSYVNREALPQEAFQKVCVLAIVRNPDSRIKAEEMMANYINSRKTAVSAVTSSSIIPEELASEGFIPKEKLQEIFEAAGCDAALTIVLKDIKVESRYNPESNQAYAPAFSYTYYDNYYRYYTFQNAADQQHNDVESSKTYFVETNLYNLENEKMIWSIQSESINPDSFDSMFRGYAKLLTKELKEKGLIK